MALWSWLCGRSSVNSERAEHCEWIYEQRPCKVLCRFGGQVGVSIESESGLRKRWLREEKREGMGRNSYAQVEKRRLTYDSARRW